MDQSIRSKDCRSSNKQTIRVDEWDEALDAIEAQQHPCSRRKQVVLSKAARKDRREIAAHTVRRFGVKEARRLRQKLEKKLTALENTRSSAVLGKRRTHALRAALDLCADRTGRAGIEDARVCDDHAGREQLRAVPVECQAHQAWACPAGKDGCALPMLRIVRSPAALHHEATAFAAQCEGGSPSRT